MNCVICGHKSHTEFEWDITGSIEVWVCFRCGWRGPIVSDNRISLGGEPMPTIKGICLGCGRERALLAKGKCYSCNGYGKKKKVEETISVEPLEQPIEEKEIIVDKEPTQTIKEIDKEESNNRDDFKLDLIFTERDSDLLMKLRNNAEKNRRTLENEILFILDNCVYEIKGVVHDKEKEN